jgi:hypothetical protein
MSNAKLVKEEPPGRDSLQPRLFFLPLFTNFVEEEFCELRLSYQFSEIQLRNAERQTSPENVRRMGGVTMAENHVSTRLPIARKPRKHRVDEDLVVRFLCHADSTHVLQTLWRGLRSAVA